MTVPIARLGDILVEQGAITRERIEQHLAKTTGRLGDYLRAHNLVRGQAVSQGLATQRQLGFVDFAKAPPDTSLFQPRDLPHYTMRHYVPYAQANGTLVIATPEPSDALQAFLSLHYRQPITLVGTGPRDLTNYFANIAATASTRRARLSLRRKYRHLVADRTLVPFQIHGILFMLAATLVALFAAPHDTWHLILVLCNLFYLTSIAVKLNLYKNGQKQRQLQLKSEPEIVRAVAAMDDESLPVYSILVPLYKESSDVMVRLIASLSALDYPRDKLDIKLICEADDHATIDALKALQPPSMMQIIAVPPSLPRTKPKACNVALQQIRGEYLVIFDAEDCPAPDQLKRAVLFFQRGGPKLACMQASLNYYNRDENLLTQLFAIEYSALFSLNLPALERLKLPIPLGGTSNHLRVAALNDAGGWDAFNVTEDADLGVRLAYLGYETRILPSLTLEEAPIALGVWMKQRTRWIKGYIQTWLVYMRDPQELKRRLGVQGYYGFQFFVGAPALTFLLAPVFWAIYIISLTHLIPSILSPFMQALCMISFIGGMAINLVFARAVLQIHGWQHMRRAMLVYPFYWLLHSVAAGRALLQLAFKPHYWEKTLHGVTKFRASDLTPAQVAV